MDYSKQALLIGIEKQENLLKKTACVVGVGGTGCAVATLLARAGVNLVLVDDDILEKSNLHRQILYSEKDVGKQKVLAAKEYLQAVNPDIKIEAIAKKLGEGNARDLLKGDIVMDCTDNLETRQVINKICYGKVPWIFCSAAEYAGMLMPFSAQGRPCFKCVFREHETELRCSSMGVLSSVPTVMGGVAATEAIKILLGKCSFGKFYHYDFEGNNINIMEVEADKECEVCGK